MTREKNEGEAQMELEKETVLESLISAVPSVEFSEIPSGLLTNSTFLA